MGLIRSAFKAVIALVLLALVFAGGWLTGRLGIGSVVAPASLTQTEREFVERMRHVTMVGTFTVAGREGRTPRPDRYDIESVEKVGDDRDHYSGTWEHLGEGGGLMSGRIEKQAGKNRRQG